MSDANEPATPAGWYPDAPDRLRWWDGATWTENTRPAAVPESPGGPAGPVSPGRRTGLVIGLAVGGLLLIGGLVTAAVLFLGGGDDAESVAKDYAEAHQMSDYERVCELADARYRESILGESFSDCEEFADEMIASDQDRRDDFEEQFGQTWDDFMDDVEVTVEVDDVEEVEEDKVVVEVRVSYAYTGDNTEAGDHYVDPDSEDEMTITVTREDGQWRVTGLR